MQLDWMTAFNFTSLPNYVYDSSSSKNTRLRFLKLHVLSLEAKFFGAAMAETCNEKEFEPHLFPLLDSV